MTLSAKVGDTIRKYGMFQRGDKVLVAVSGGADSVALLRLLADLREELGLALEVAHLEHGIRGDEAREDALFVARLAEEFSLPFHFRKVDLPRIRKTSGGGNLEAMARKERYDFFGALARERGIRQVATAHTRDDQVETLLMWLLRGSGGRGLGAIPPIRRLDAKGEGLWLVRPMIETSRQEVIGYLTAQGFSYRTDRTNLDRTRLRNWIRLELLPQLRARLDPRLDARLAQAADLLREEEEVLNLLTEERLEQAARAGDLLRDAVLRESKAVQRRLIRLWLERTAGNLKGIGFYHVEKILRFIADGPSQGRLSIPGGWDFVKEYAVLRLEKKRYKPERLSYSYPLPHQGELVIPEAGVKLKSSCHPCTPPARPRNNLEAVFDLALLPEFLEVRNFRPGDRFRPLGMGGRKKVKELFIEKRVPLSARSAYPLVLAGEEILWIPGYGRSAVAAVSPGTRALLRVELVSPAD